MDEVKIGAGKAVDVVAINEKERVAIEVETGKSDVIGNVRKCQSGKFNRVVVVAVSENVKKKIQALLEKHRIEGTVEVNLCLN